VVVFARLVLAALALVVFGAIECPPKKQHFLRYFVLKYQKSQQQKMLTL